MNKGIKTLKLHASVWFKEEKGSRAEPFSAIKATQLKEKQKVKFGELFLLTSMALLIVSGKGIWSSIILVLLWAYVICGEVFELIRGIKMPKGSPSKQTIATEKICSKGRYHCKKL